jgi:hypothetical protein
MTGEPSDGLVELMGFCFSMFGPRETNSYPALEPIIQQPLPVCQLLETLSGTEGQLHEATDPG